MRVNVITYPGSNCDHDAHEVFLERGHDSRLIWHRESELQEPDLVVLPGGFSYGDYLRCGALARFSPIVKEVVDFANSGGLVLGICNGFQILTECGLLPGALMMNSGLQFICSHQYLRVESSKTPFTGTIQTGTVLDIPIAHKEGNFFIDEHSLRDLDANDQIVFRYSDAAGNISPEANPNGSLANIAGICNKKRNVLGMMPHPERAAAQRVKYHDGRQIFEALEEYIVSSG